MKTTPAVKLTVFSVKVSDNSIQQKSNVCPSKIKQTQNKFKGSNLKLLKNSAKDTTSCMNC